MVALRVLALLALIGAWSIPRFCDDSSFWRFKAFFKSSNSSCLQRRDDRLLLCGSYEAFKLNIQQWAVCHETCETLDDPHHRSYRHVTGWHFRSGECLWASVWFLKGGAAVITQTLSLNDMLVFTTVFFVLTGREVSNRHKSHFCLHGRKMSTSSSDSPEQHLRRRLFSFLRSGKMNSLLGIPLASVEWSCCPFRCRCSGYRMSSSERSV